MGRAIVAILKGMATPASVVRVIIAVQVRATIKATHASPNATGPTTAAPTATVGATEFILVGMQTVTAHADSAPKVSYAWS